ncbi:MAG: hypothetical protein OEW15_08020 [Nitrospirota bacterium]|nr:hypothetical protein [Nitrospirota bacterium]
MEKKHIFDKPENVKRFLLGFYLLLGISLAAELFVHKHAYFWWEHYPFFHAAFGLVAFVALILAAKHFLGPLVRKRENYYD